MDSVQIGTQRYCCYVDYTSEPTPRPFYVGKGTRERIETLGRNLKHAQVALKYGLNRRVLLETDDPQEALEAEARYIREFRTWKGDPQASELACNLTSGGGSAQKTGSREGKVTMYFRVTPEVRRTIRIYMAEHDIQLDELILEALTGLGVIPE
jgi:hypothetical protein